MTIQQAWRVKRMMMFGTFVCAGIFLPFLPIRIPRICLFEKLLGIPCPGCVVFILLSYLCCAGIGANPLCTIQWAPLSFLFAPDCQSTFYML